MDDFLYYALIILSCSIIFFIGMLYGWGLHQRMMVRRIRSALSELGQTLEDEIVEVSIEKHDDVIYVYDKHTKQFMAQGKDRKEVEQILAEKFPGKRFAAPQTEIEQGLTK